MKRRYKVRLHESGDHDGEVTSGTIVQHIGGSTTIEARSIEEAERSVREQVGRGMLGRGCVYQICPPPGGVEDLRSLAVALDGQFQDCQLETAHGLYSEFRRIRLF